ncbi:MAG: glycosyltransferase family 2 protein [Verrucomicrobiia bacterium]
MKISIITPVYNNRETISDCINSVLNQSYKDIEYIIVDGCSDDGTIEVIKNNPNIGRIKLISDRDKGLYDAINKGIKLSTGEIIGFLHSDDLYGNNYIVEKVVNILKQNEIDGIYGDIQYVDKNNINKVIRNWIAGEYYPEKFKCGWHPPHTTLFLKRDIYVKYGLYNDKFYISGDYEIMLRFIHKYGIKIKYLPEVLVKMRMGGKSNKSIRNILIQTIEDYNAWKINGLRGGLLAVILKKLRKIPQYF